MIALTRTLNRNMTVNLRKRSSPFTKCIAAEENFRSVMVSRGITLERPAEPFWFIKSCYLPDFYSPSENVFYEVVGGDSQRHHLFYRLDLMQMFYPEVSVIPMMADGKPYKYRLHRSKRDWAAVPFADELHETLDRERMTCSDLASRMGMTPTRLSMVLNGYRVGPSDKIHLSRVRAWLTAVNRISIGGCDDKRRFVTDTNSRPVALHTTSQPAG